MNNTVLNSEILMNMKEIKGRINALNTLLGCTNNKTVRTEELSFKEYDEFWDDFWETKEYFRKDLPCLKNGVPMNPNISPFEYKKNITIPLIAEKIRKYNVKSVLEIGSGAGLNLMMLAPLFPNVKFVGLEPSDSGVRVSQNFITNPPIEFDSAFEAGIIRNVSIIKGSLLDKEVIEEIQGSSYDLVFTNAVLEQLNNYIDLAFNNIFSINFKYFLFIEEWLEANYSVDKYKVLLDSDYFRTSVQYLNGFPCELIEFLIPTIQPSWLNYASAFGTKSYE